MWETLTSYFKQLGAIFSQPLFELGDHKISIASLFTAFLIIFIFIHASRIIERIIRHALKDKPIDLGVVGSIARFSRYLIITIGVFVALDTIGIKLTALAAFGAVLMVGIGFGLQNITQNFISGLIILLERPIKEGDIVKVGDTIGRVYEIRVRATVIHTRDDVAIIVPNSQFISESVVNDSFTGKKIRMHVKVGVAYGSDVEKVKKVLVEIAREHKSVLNRPAPLVVFENFGSSSLDFDLRIWIRDIWNQDVILSDLRFAIDREFRKNKIQIPFPQRDLHIRSGSHAT